MNLRKLTLLVVAVLTTLVLTATNSHADQTCCQLTLHFLHCSSPGCTGSIQYYSCQEVTSGVWANGPNSLGCCTFTQDGYLSLDQLCFEVAPAQLREGRIEGQAHYVYFRTCSGKYVILRPQIEEFGRSPQAGS